jgi:hypothetical protein
MSASAFQSLIVMAGLVPAIHVFPAATVVKSWMPGTSPGKTGFKMSAGAFQSGVGLRALNSSSGSRIPRLL